MTNYEPTGGSVVHVELTSDDVEASRAFFEDVFRWTIEVDEEEDYAVWRPSNPPGGGIVAPDGPGATLSDQPPTLLYVEVEDLGATREAVVGAGGEVLREEVPVGERGVFSAFREPGGIVEAAWETRSEDEPEAGWSTFTDDPEPGSVTHFELYSGDPEATRTFHEAVFGWEFEAVEGSGYTTIRPPTPPFGGLLGAGEAMPVGVLLYLLVDGAEAACESIEATGGRVLREPFDVEGWGTMAVFEAPGGVTQALWANPAD
jgi:predicted enzyme related to lactoylglutathione lyase